MKNPLLILLLAIALPAAGAPPPAESPFACDMLALTPTIRKRHFDELGPQLGGLIKQIRELPDGYEFQFPSDTNIYLLLAEFAAWEPRCCPFFEIVIRQEREHGPLWFRLTGRKGVKAFIREEFSPWFNR